MAKRRGRGEGTITQRADGRWMARVQIDRDVPGPRKRKTVYGVTRAEVAEKMNDLLGRSADRSLLTTTTPTLRVWLDDWFETHREDWRTSTRHAYRAAIDRWIVPALGTVRLDALQPLTVQRWVNAASKGGPRPIVVLAHVVLHSALKWAMRQRLISYNAAELVRVPRPKAKQAAHLTAGQAGAVLDAAADHRLGALVVTSLSLGVRIGEVIGLTWADVDLTARTLRVRQQVQPVTGGGFEVVALKTATSQRKLAMPDLLVRALTAHRKRQLAERLQAGAAWAPDGDYVFTTPTGGIVSPRAARAALAGLLTVAGVPRVKFHALRHTAATLLLQGGTPLFDVSRILGHAEVSTTADTYGHLTDEMTVAASARMDDLLVARRRGGVS